MYRQCTGTLATPRSSRGGLRHERTRLQLVPCHVPRALSEHACPERRRRGPARRPRHANYSTTLLLPPACVPGLLETVFRVVHVWEHCAKLCCYRLRVVWRWPAAAVRPAAQACSVVPRALRLEWRRSCIAAQRSAARSQTRSMRWRVCPPARRVASPAHSYTSAQVTQGMISPAVAMKVLEQVR